MSVFVRALIFRSLCGSGLVLLLSVPLCAAVPPDRAKSRQEESGGKVEVIEEVAPGSEPISRLDEPFESRSIDVLEGLRSRQLAVAAEGTGDGRMILSLTNQTKQKLRVVLPPGLVASSATGQFGGMGGGGGRGGRGRRGGGMGMGGGGMGRGMGGGMGMGGGGMGGMGMGGGGMGMGGGGMGMVSGTIPASMGMMMVGQLIMTMVGDRDSWDQTTLMSGMMGGGGMGMGMGGMGMGGMGGMGGMSRGGMGGMRGQGGGFRSVPAGRMPEAILEPRETRHLPTVAISLDGPRDDAQVSMPAKGERLRIGEIGQLGRGSRTEAALKRLAANKAPETVAQLVLWNVAAGVEWSKVSTLSQSWANPAELALAKQFVSRLRGTRLALETPDSGHLFWDEGPRESDASSLAAALGGLLEKNLVLGLKPEHGVPTSPAGPALACRFTIVTGKVRVELATSDPSGRSWKSLGSLSIPIGSLEGDQAAIESMAAEVIGSMSAGLLGRVARAQLIKGPKAKGKDTYTIRIDNGSPLIVSGVAIAGPDTSKPTPFAALGGLGLSPLTSLQLPVTPEIVESLGLKQRVRIVAVDLGGL